MTVQPRLLDPGPADGNLNDNEQLVLTLLRDHPGGLRAIDIGRHLHIDGSYQCRICNADRTCEFAMPNAGRVLDRLGTPTDANPRGRGLVIRRQGGLWQLTRPPVTGHDPATADWPAGF